MAETPNDTTHENQTMCDIHPNQVDNETCPCLKCQQCFPEMFIPFLYGNIRKDVIKEHIECAFGLVVCSVRFGKMRKNRNGTDGHSIYITVNWIEENMDIRNDICAGEQYELEDVPGGKWLICKNTNCNPKKKRNPTLKKTLAPYCQQTKKVLPWIRPVPSLRPIPWMRPISWIRLLIYYRAN